MNPLRLLAITALFAWFIFPSQSLSQCDGAIELTVTLTTDDWPGETTWSLVDETGNVLLEGGPYLQDFQTFTAVDCAGPGCYAFTIEDTFGDGICCGYGNGGYSIAADDVVLATGGNFGYQTTESFCLEFLCTDEAACNYDPTAEVVDPSEENCQYPEDLFGPGYDCEGQCINDEDGDDVCVEVDPCIGEFDACGVYNGRVRYTSAAALTNLKRIAIATATSLMPWEKAAIVLLMQMRTAFATSAFLLQDSRLTSTRSWCTPRVLPRRSRTKCL